MNDQSSNAGVSMGDAAGSAEPARLSANALARRRLLLKGATGSAAALAALKPVGALATGTSTVLICKNAQGKDTLCSISGVQSAAHSFGPNVTQVPACGKAKSYWTSNTGAWPTCSPSTCKTTTATGSVLSGCASTYTNKAALATLQDSSNPIEADFICAYLNGTLLYDPAGPSLSKCFPYSSAQVQAFWNAGGATRTNAQALFKAISTLTT